MAAFPATELRAAYLASPTPEQVAAADRGLLELLRQAGLLTMPQVLVALESLATKTDIQQLPPQDVTPAADAVAAAAEGEEGAAASAKLRGGRLGRGHVGARQRAAVDGALGERGGQEAQAEWLERQGRRAQVPVELPAVAPGSG